MFENPRGGRQARNFTKSVPKILDLKSSSEEIFSENWRWVPLAIFKILFKFYSFVVVGFRSLPERFYPGFFLFLDPFKRFQNEHTSKTQSVSCLVSCAAVSVSSRKRAEKRPKERLWKKRNCGGWRAALSLCFLKNLYFILFYFIFLLLFTVKSISRRV